MEKEITQQEARQLSKEGLHFTDDKKLSIEAKGFIAWAVRQPKNTIDMSFYKGVSDYCECSYPKAFEIAQNLYNRGFCHKTRLGDNSKIWTFFDKSYKIKRENNEN